MLTPDQCKRLVEILRARIPGLRAIYLFGSQVIEGGRWATPESDADLAYLADFKPVLTGLEKWELQSTLASELKLPWVDLIDIGVEQDHVLFENVLRGVRLQASPLHEVIAWEAQRCRLAQEWRLSTHVWRKEYLDTILSHEH